MGKFQLFILFVLSNSLITSPLFSQGDQLGNEKREAILVLIDQYAQAREKSDTVLLRSILTADVDQLVSSGEWRVGIGESIQGMLRSSAGNPGTRSLKVEKMRFLSEESAIVDAGYEIRNSDGAVRKMWSTFLVVYDEEKWKIAAIRNMLPAGTR